MEDERAKGIKQSAMPVCDLLTLLLSTQSSFSLASHLAKEMQSLRIEIPDGVRLPISQLDATSHIHSLNVLEALVEKVAEASSKWESNQRRDAIAGFCQVGPGGPLRGGLVQQFQIGMWPSAST
jgi:hypothetical protein